jgi:hypothetical protein
VSGCAFVGVRGVVVAPGGPEVGLCRVFLCEVCGLFRGGDVGGRRPVAVAPGERGPLVLELPEPGRDLALAPREVGGRRTALVLARRGRVVHRPMIPAELRSGTA